MRAVVQRVARAEVRVSGRSVGQIGRGLLVLIGIGRDDVLDDAAYLAEKIVHLRIFSDTAGKMNLSVKEIAGEFLAVSQFTLYADCRKGRRPAFAAARPAPESEALFNHFVARVRAEGVAVATGEFGAMMEVELVNWGPVTILLDSKKDF
jgi:D-tyrosyl-tRNA(Tyr) deacylase